MFARVTHIMPDPIMRIASGFTAAITTLSFAAAVLAWSPVAQADAAVDWNAIAADAIATASPPRPGPVGFLDIAVVQVAAYDAVQAIGGKFKPFRTEIPQASGSPEAAAAKAAHDVLVNIFPTQAASLGTTYRDYLTKKGLTEADPGVAVGEKAAAGIVAWRANDGRVPTTPPPGFTGSKETGVWRPTTSYQAGPPPSDAPMATPWLGTVPGFTLERGDQFRAKPPPDLTSERYTKDYTEVKALGASSNSSRTEQQNNLAHFYFGTNGNNFILWQTTLRDLAVKPNNISDSARLLMLGTVAMADSVIVAWDSKKQYVLWRPVTAIQEGENDGNPATAGDPGWQPLLNTPPYPEYSSGANNVTGALTRILALFFGKDDMAFTVSSLYPQAAQKTRTYSRFSEMASDMVDTRIYQGIHFRFGDEAGRDQGTQVAEWVFGHVGTPK
jgi:hypothetical protein